MTDAKANFPSMFQNNIYCDLCDKTKFQTVQHLLCCPEIIKRCNMLQNNINVNFEDIFSEGESQIMAMRVIKAVFDTKQEIEAERERKESQSI